MNRIKLTKSKNEIAGIHYTTNHTAKMLGMVSLSTDINLNPFCQARRKKQDSICAVCFSARMWDDKKGAYRNNNSFLKKNSEILCNRILSEDEIPYIDPENFPLFRFESFGDLSTPTQVINYFKIAKLNPDVKFALWTKNPGLINKALRFTDKPDNIQIVLSSSGLNKPANVYFPFIDKVFTVYDKEAAKNVDINCGARSCRKCQLCYNKNPKGDQVVHVREIVK